jgi:serine/threonine protein kinase
MMTGCGSTLWMAPEIIDGKTFNEKVDVYSYAMCLVEVIDRNLPWASSGIGIVPLKVSRGERPEGQLRSAAPPLAELVKECWAQDPRERPSFADVIERVAAMQAALGSADTAQTPVPRTTGTGIAPVPEGVEGTEPADSGGRSAELGGAE